VSTINPHGDVSDIAVGDGCLLWTTYGTNGFWALNLWDHRRRDLDTSARYPAVGMSMASPGASNAALPTYSGLYVFRNVCPP
jgi:hypothetical protein